MRQQQQALLVRSPLRAGRDAGAPPDTVLTEQRRERTEAVEQAPGAILRVVDEVLARCAEVDPNLLHSGTVPGRALGALAEVTRAATSALGAAPRGTLAAGPGVVVLRDLVMAAQLLAATARSRSVLTGGGELRVAALAVTARDLGEVVVRALTPTT